MRADLGRSLALLDLSEDGLELACAVLDRGYRHPDKIRDALRARWFEGGLRVARPVAGWWDREGGVAEQRKTR